MPFNFYSSKFFNSRVTACYNWKVVKDYYIIYESKNIFNLPTVTYIGHERVRSKPSFSYGLDIRTKTCQASFMCQTFYICFLPNRIIWMTSLSVSVMLSGVENSDPKFYDSSFKWLSSFYKFFLLNDIWSDLANNWFTFMSLRQFKIFWII